MSPKAAREPQILGFPLYPVATAEGNPAACTRGRDAS